MQLFSRIQTAKIQLFSNSLEYILQLFSDGRYSFLPQISQINADSFSAQISEFCEKAIRLILFHNRVQFHEFALMALTVVDKLGHLLSYRVDVVEAGETHVAVEVGGGGTRVHRENLQRGVVLLELDGHHAHHGVLGGLARHVG